MRKFFAYLFAATAGAALWFGFAQPASAGEPHGDDTVVTHHEACTSEQVLVNAQCVNVDLGVDDVVGDVTDSVDNLVDDLL